jgi:exodeoxyribonuclease VII small subunit
MAKIKDAKNPFEKLTFEEAIDTLGGIVQKIETGQVPLQESLEQYEQGMGLIQHCRKILLDAEKRIEIIHEKARPADTPTDESEDEDDDTDINEDDEGLF